MPPMAVARTGLVLNADAVFNAGVIRCGGVVIFCGAVAIDVVAVDVFGCFPLPKLSFDFFLLFSGCSQRKAFRCMVVMWALLDMCTLR